MFRVYRATVIRHASKMTVSGRKLSAQHFCAVVVEGHMRTEGGLVVSYRAVEAVDELGNTINRTEVHGDGGDDDAEDEHFHVAVEGSRSPVLAFDVVALVERTIFRAPPRVLGHKVAKEGHGHFEGMMIVRPQKNDKCFGRVPI